MQNATKQGLGTKKQSQSMQKKIKNGTEILWVQNTVKWVNIAFKLGILIDFFLCYAVESSISVTTVQLH